MTTTIQIKNETWKILNNMKQTPKESFDDVIKRVLNDYFRYIRVINKEVKKK